MPVEKIDKTESRSTYYVESAVETKDDRSHQQDQRQSSDEYSGSHAAPGWQKAYAAMANRKYLKLRREDIVRAWFRGATMQKGVSLAEMDIELKGQKFLKNAHVILSTREDFWTLKHYQPGQDVPLNMFVKDAIVEVSVPAPMPAQQANAAGSFAAGKIASVRMDHKKLLIYIAIGTGVAALLLFLILR